MLFRILLFSLFVVFSTQDLKMPVFNVDLEAPPEIRYREAIDHYKNNVSVIHTLIKTIIPKWALGLAEFAGRKLLSRFKPEYRRELEVIAELSGAKLGDLVLVNYMYELGTKACTTIVAQNQDGVVMFARNLDYGFGEILRDFTMMVNFQRKNHTVFTVLTHPGYIGAVTGVRWNQFALDINQRESSLFLNFLLAALRFNFRPVGILLREILEDDSMTFDKAAAALQDEPLIANAYLSVGGAHPGQGVIVTRNRQGPDDVWKLGPGRGTWFLVETNDDHWEKPRDGRRAKALAGMRKLDGKFHEKELYAVLSKPPILNAQTIYTTVIDPSRPESIRKFTHIRDYHGKEYPSKIGKFDDLNDL